MLFIVKTSFICAGAVGLAFIGYAIYFDYRRRQSMNYKAMIRLKRKSNFYQKSLNPKVSFDFSSLKHIFLQEVQLGEEKLLNGFVQEGIEHLATAIIMCNKPDQVLNVFRRTLVEEHYILLEKAFPKAIKKFKQMIERTNEGIVKR